MNTTMTGFLRFAMAVVTMTASLSAETEAVRHIGGLPGVRPRAMGKLIRTDQGITFEERGASTFVYAAQIVKVSIDDERNLKGGFFGEFLRTGIPFAGGLGIGMSGLSESFGSVPFAFGLLATAFMQSHSHVLTVEYFDPHDGYHGAVFIMSRHAAEDIQRQFTSGVVPPKVEQPKNGCPAIITDPHSIVMLPVSSQVAEIPGEYRVLTYEHVFETLQRKVSGWHVRRLGDTNDLAVCGEWKLTITVNAFHKGNAVERALIGPIGQFVGVTNLSCRIVLNNSRGDSLLDEDVKAAIRGDRESLDLGDVVSKAIARKIRKVVDQS